MSRPELNEWLALPNDELAALVRSHNLAVLLSIDGTRRHYLIVHPQENGRITNYDTYFQHSAKAYVRVYDLLFSLGIQTIMTPNLYPLNFLRGGESLQRFLKMSSAYLGSSYYATLYERWKVKARLYGDFDIAPNAVPVREGLQALGQELIESTPEGDRLLLFGYCAGSFNEELIARTVDLYQRFGRLPTEDEVRDACFPFGPSQLDVFIRAGAIRNRVLPPILDRGTNLYSLVHLALDLTENTARRILYDHLFRRGEAPEDNMDYTAEDLSIMADYYRTHSECVVGLGQLVGPSLWYADHDLGQHSTLR